MAAEADLCLLPFRNSQEDIDSLRLDLNSIPTALAWPSAWPTNKFAETSAQRLIDELAKEFPGRVIQSPVYFVNATNELLDRSLDSPSTHVRSAARRAFSIISDHYDRIQQATSQAETPSNVRPISALAR
jgi:chromosome partitioning protein